ncbi:MAG: dipeptidase [Pseudomonadota bacterium]
MQNTLTITTYPLLFDGHNDQLSVLDAGGAARAVQRFRSNPTTAIDLEKARAGGFAGGFFAIWVPSDDHALGDITAMAEAPFDIPLPAPVPREAADRAVHAQLSIASMLEREGLIRICRSVADIRAAMNEGIVAALLHIEGAEAIGEDLAALDVFYAAGLRSLGPVWSRPNHFGHGVPFRFPSGPDTGPGLTPAGRALIKRCNALKIMVDLSHLNEAGFWDVAEISTQPLVATHSNAHALCHSARNLTDEQLSAIAQSRGIVGVNFATAFLRSDGRMATDVPLDVVVDHLDYLLERLGEDGVAFGSDYDGAAVPQEIATVDQIPLLRQAMAARGYSPALMTKIFHDNWLRVLSETLGG